MSVEIEGGIYPKWHPLPKSLPGKTFMLVVDAVLLAEGIGKFGMRSLAFLEVRTSGYQARLGWAGLGCQKLVIRAVVVIDSGIL